MKNESDTTVKNMSFGKMMGIFAGFLILVTIVAVIIVKMNRKSGSNIPQVTTKTYQHSGPPTAVSPASIPPNQATAGNPSAQAPFQAVTNTVTPRSQTDMQGVGVVTQTTLQQGVTNVPVDLNLHLTKIDNTIANLESRVAALEGKLAVAASLRRKPVQHRTPANREKLMAIDEGKRLKPLPGYKAMAIVRNRAWVSAPDGNEDSLIQGDPITRVRTMNGSSGVVITTTDQRIEPR